MSERTELEAQLAEAKQNLSDLTRELNESPAAEKNPMFARKLDEARERVVQLEEQLAELDRS